MNDVQLEWKWTRLYVDNIPPAVQLILENDASKNQIYNLGEEKALSLRELYTLIRTAVKPRYLNTQPHSYEQRISADHFNYKQHLIMDSTKIRNVLGYKEIIDPHIAVVKTIESSLIS